MAKCRALFAGHWYSEPSERMEISMSGRPGRYPDIALDRAVAAYRKSDYSFKCRIKKGGSYLTAKDAETIIRLATHDVIHLELIEQPTHKYY